MNIYFVRHGHPDYNCDCLTELGHRQAEAAALRLRDSGIERVFSSSKGRAIQTAEYTAKQLGLEVVPCDFMREIDWGRLGDEPILANGNPWKIVEIFASMGKTICDADWRIHEPFCRSKLINSTETVITGIDVWLEELGYRREGEYYRVVGENTDRTVAMFGHGGSFTAALSHLFNNSFLQKCGMLHMDFTGVAVVRLPDKQGELVHPSLISTDAHHIIGLETENVYGM